MNLSDELSKLAELRAGGTLTEDEFARAKARLLDGAAASASAAAASGSTAAGSATDPAVGAINAFRRSRTDRLLGGVCGGLARATGVESWIWRLLFAVLFIFAGAGLLAYVLLWIFVPSD